MTDVSWEGYEKLLDEVGDSAVRMTYDSGYLEFELPNELHERLTKLVGAMVEAALEAADVDFQPLGSTTWRRRPRAKGLEADDCYYIASLQQIEGKPKVDLEIDPPPDLAIETEVTSPLLDKLAVYAGLGVPELWRVGETGDVRILRLTVDGKYELVAASQVLPRLGSALLSQYAKMLEPIGTMPHSRVIKQFRQWLASRQD